MFCLIYVFSFSKNFTCLKIDCSNINNYLISHEIASRLLASFLMLGPRLSRFGSVSTVFPGGCNIGKRPVDIQIKTLEAMGAKIKIHSCNISATKRKLQGKEITFEKVSVGATENIIMAATLAEAVTIINNAAIEPGVLDLIEFLTIMDANIEVNNTKITIKVVEALNGHEHKIRLDRIEAGTYALAAVITDGELKLEGVSLSDIGCILNELKTVEARVELHDDGIIISRKMVLLNLLTLQQIHIPTFPMICKHN